MDSHTFAQARKVLGKTQKQMSELLGVSLKAVHSYEQGWRSIPVHVERQVYFLMACRKGLRGLNDDAFTCWEIKNCPDELKKKCPAWEFHAGRFCWFINGTLCECRAQKNWKEKMKICRKCLVLKTLLGSWSD